MTVTELIQLLKPLEFGGATGKPREITFWIKNKPYNNIEVIGTGDGLVTDIDLEISK